MTDETAARHPVHHTEFAVERLLKASPRHAFRFWSDPALKARWNDCHTDWTVLEDRFDFHVGGGERKHWRTPEGEALTFAAYYLDIVPEHRIIYAYEMSFAGQRLSASLVTVAFAPDAGGTRLTFTEQAALLDGGDAERRIAGTEEGIDRLAACLAAEGPADAA